MTNEFYFFHNLLSDRGNVFVPHFYVLCYLTPERLCHHSGMRDIVCYSIVLLLLVLCSLQLTFLYLVHLIHSEFLKVLASSPTLYFLEALLIRPYTLVVPLVELDANFSL